MEKGVWHYSPPDGTIAFDVVNKTSWLARLTRNLIIGYEITALLELEQHCRPSFQGVNDI